MFLFLTQESLDNFRASSGWGAGVAAGCGRGAGCTPPLTGVGGTTAWQAVSHSSKSNPTSALGAGWRRPRLAN